MEMISPGTVLARLVRDMPQGCKGNTIVVGSLAVAYHYFKDEEEAEVRTKDIDCLLAPREDIVRTGEQLTKELLDRGWETRKIGGFGVPQDTPEPTDTLSAVRLNPPGREGWFVEFLVVPESETDKGRKWIPIEADDGWYGIPSFEFLSLAAYRPMETKFGIRYARPEMMALANLLSHPKIGPEPMSTLYEGRPFKRSNKDLGRVLAIARLEAEASMAGWAELMAEALKTAFPTRYPELIQQAGSGIESCSTATKT